MPFVGIPEAIEEIRAGRIVVVVDDEDRENEGDLTIAAEKVTPRSSISWPRTAAGSSACPHPGTLRLPPAAADELPEHSNFGTAFCESIDGRAGVTTGISAADRTAPSSPPSVQIAGRGPRAARPCLSLARARRGRAGARRPDGGVRGPRPSRRPDPAGVICEVMNDDGTMARVAQLREFCARHSLKMISVADLIRHRMKTERFIRRLAEGSIETEFGNSAPSPTAAT